MKNYEIKYIIKSHIYFYILTDITFILLSITFFIYFLFIERIFCRDCELILFVLCI